MAATEAVVAAQAVAATEAVAAAVAVAVAEAVAAAVAVAVAVAVAAVAAPAASAAAAAVEAARAAAAAKMAPGRVAAQTSVALVVPSVPGKISSSRFEAELQAAMRQLAPLLDQPAQQRAWLRRFQARIRRVPRVPLAPLAPRAPRGVLRWRRQRLRGHRRRPCYALWALTPLPVPMLLVWARRMALMMRRPRPYRRRAPPRRLTPEIPPNEPFGAVHLEVVVQAAVARLQASRAEREGAVPLAAETEKVVDETALLHERCLRRLESPRKGRRQ